MRIGTGINLPDFGGLKPVRKVDLLMVNEKSALSPEGALLIKLINATGNPSIKGYTVDISTTTNNAVRLTTQGVPDCIGVFYESGIPDGTEAWIAVSGIADVYFVSATTVGYLARTFIAADADYVSGQAKSEAVPTPPFDTDKHFCEIGHILETRLDAGLAKCVLHFN